MDKKYLHGRLKILVLDDDKFVRSVLRKILGGEYDVLVTENAKSFREKVVPFRPDIIFLDLTLPDGNGLDLCEEIRRNHAFDNSFVLILTGVDDPAALERGYASGADDYIRKPLVPYEIQSKVEIFGRIIRSRTHLHRAYEQELNLNRQLYKISNLIQENLETTTSDSTGLVVEGFPDVIPVDYFELVRITDDRIETLFSKKYKSASGNWSFAHLYEKGFFPRDMKESMKYFRIKTRINLVFCCIATLYLNNKRQGYMLLLRDFPFREDDRKLISLLADFVSLINDRTLFHREIEGRNRAYKNEIDKIRKIQATTIPDFSMLKGFDVSFSYLPASELSGDFFDGFFVNDDIYELILCDVSGHGIASSYVGNQIRTLFREASSNTRTPAEIASIVNNHMLRDFAGLYYYCTVVILQVDISNGTLRYLSAGHPDALYYDSRRKNVRVLPQTGPLVGLFPDSVYTYTEIPMTDEDILFVYTDGVTEALAVSSTEMYGIERLTNAFAHSINQPPQELVYSILGSMYEYTDYREQDDDITIICLKRCFPSGAGTPEAGSHE